MINIYLQLLSFEGIFPINIQWWVYINNAWKGWLAYICVRIYSAWKLMNRLSRTVSKKGKKATFYLTSCTYVAILPKLNQLLTRDIRGGNTYAKDRDIWIPGSGLRSPHVMLITISHITTITIVSCRIKMSSDIFLILKILGSSCCKAESY